MRKTISIVLPVHNELGNLALIYKKLIKTLRSLKYDLELVFVNDGSQDGSMAKLVKLADDDPRVMVIDLSRNFGHQLAITAGIDYAKGDAIITMDSDLQDPPEICPLLIKKWEEGYDVVYAKRRNRQGDSLFKRLSAQLFYGLLNKMSETSIPSNVGDFRLIDKKVAVELRKLREHQRFLRGLVSYVGFKQTIVLFDRARRHSGKTGYPLKKMLGFARDGIISFSTVPLRIITRLGYLVSLLSLAGIIYAVSIKLFDPARAVPGWAFVTVAIFFIGGVQFIMLGLLGSYIARIYTEAQDRPLYIVAAIHGKRAARSPQSDSSLSLVAKTQRS
ncbi:MAG TPA: glycosyltransferase family 2 protein [Candidatus Nitrosopolaris sp.]|nr:glycosyltransferase family 2 protein [Candidatus Nitrosopolaris sp.]